MDFSVEDKRQIALALDGLGMDYIEGGWPGANPTDTAFFAERPPLKHARFTAFGMTKRSGRSAANDPSLAQVLDAAVDAICLVGKTSDYPGEDRAGNSAGGKSRQYRPLDRGDRREEAASRCSMPSISSTATRPIPTMRWPASAPPMRRARKWIVLCDTNGGAMPEEVYRIVSEVKATLPGGRAGHPCP